jgi:copper chaperone
MALKLKVPTIVCSGCANTIKEAIITVDSDAKVDVDVEAKTVTLESQAAEESFKQAIVATGHTIEGYQ